MLALKRMRKRQSVNAMTLAFLIVVFLGWLNPHASLAQKKVGAAREQFAAATTAFEQGRFNEAALLFETAARLSPHANAWLAAARAWRNADRPDRTATALNQALALKQMSDRDRRSSQRELQLLRPSLGQIDATVSHAPWVTVDSDPEVAPPARIFVLPGIHRVALRNGDDVKMLPAVSFERGEIKRAEELWAAELAAPTAPEPPSRVNEAEPSPPALKTNSSVESALVVSDDTKSASVSSAIEVRKSSAVPVVVSATLAGLGLGAFVLSGFSWSQATGSANAYRRDPFALTSLQSYPEAQRFTVLTNVALACGFALLSAAVITLVVSLWPHADTAPP
jgi:tetratricopeptide (TPR) repeat protein